MDNAIRISHLNDFLFCPYSIYLHNIYDAIDDHQYHDVPQMKSPALDYLMGVEGNAAKLYFQQYFVDMKSATWKGRKPRLKIDPINVTLGIGYTLLFNFVECIVRLFGFDVYVGVLHQLWFRRKSLICDFVEPFRCIVDKQVVKSFRLAQFDVKYFTLSNARYSLKAKHISDYNAVLMSAIVKYKLKIFNTLAQKSPTSKVVG